MSSLALGDTGRRRSSARTRNEVMPLTVALRRGNWLTVTPPTSRLEGGVTSLSQCVRASERRSDIPQQRQKQQEAVEGKQDTSPLSGVQERRSETPFARVISVFSRHFPLRDFLG